MGRAIAQVLVPAMYCLEPENWPGFQAYAIKTLLLDDPADEAKITASCTPHALMRACAILSIMLGSINNAHPFGPDGPNLMTEEANGSDN
jgi:hypothetical protein